MEDLMIRPLEAAKLLHVGRTQIYRLIKAKEIPSRRVGKSIRIPVAELKAWAAGEMKAAQSSLAGRKVAK